jgi:tetratricopeptide (TPR) repeat protein
MIEIDPRQAADVARFALAVAGGITASAYPRVAYKKCIAHVWINLATARRISGNSKAALRALDAADRYLRQEPALQWDDAVAKLARAVACAEVNSAEAEPLLADAASVFKRYDDKRRQGQCFLLSGMIKHRRAEYSEACADYDGAVAVLDGTDDLQSRASAANNLGAARIELRQFSEAVIALHCARALFMELGCITELARTTTLLASVHIETGKYAAARDLLLEARHTFASLDMTEEAGICGLSLAEALLALRETFRASAVIEEVLGDFARAKLDKRVMEAVLYLRRIVEQAEQGAIPAARHVAQFVRAFQRNPTVEFYALER